MTGAGATGRGAPHHDGDGWVECAQGHRHWGRSGAAGLLLHRAAPAGGQQELLLQHRAEWSHHGGTWGLLGGARRSDETAVAAALREAREESGLHPGPVQVNGRYDDDHGVWSYVTVLAEAVGDVGAHAASGESVEVAWWPADDLPALLHPGFAMTWPVLRDATTPLRVVVDAANVVGSRPDGWWRDRAGAARRLIDGVAGLGERGVADSVLPDALHRAPLRRWWPHLVVVVEGAARVAAGDSQPSRGQVRVVAAPGSGDNAIVAAVADQADASGPTLVVTADRELRARCEALGANTVGPRWLLELLEPR